MGTVPPAPGRTTGLYSWEPGAGGGAAFRIAGGGRKDRGPWSSAKSDPSLPQHSPAWPSLPFRPRLSSRGRAASGSYLDRGLQGTGGAEGAETWGIAPRPQSPGPAQGLVRASPRTESVTPGEPRPRPANRVSVDLRVTPRAPALCSPIRAQFRVSGQANRPRVRGGGGGAPGGGGGAARPAGSRERAEPALDREAAEDDGAGGRRVRTWGPRPRRWAAEAEGLSWRAWGSQRPGLFVRRFSGGVRVRVREAFEDGGPRARRAECGEPTA